MKTSVDILAGLIAVKELEIKALKERISQLRQQIDYLSDENTQLYAILAQEQQKQQAEEHKIGFKGGVK